MTRHGRPQRAAYPARQRSYGNILVTPVDQPGISAAEVARVIAAHAPGGITAAASAHDDVGARELLLAHHDTVTLLDCSDLDDGADIDVPADLHRYDTGTGTVGPRLLNDPRCVSAHSDGAKCSRG